MLMQAQPVYDAWKSVVDRIGYKPRTVYLTPQGPTFTQPMAKDLAQEKDLILLCGHYEGIDERVLEEIVTDYVSIGDYVLTGGELPAMVMVDAISRMVPGVLTNDESGSTESFEGNLLEYPQYSRPEEWMGKKVPSILLSGDHKKVDEWRREQAILRTIERRPDLLKKEELSSLPEIRRQIDALKEQIKSLGNINVNAIEDYREVSERYEFMRAQHEDLVNAQAELVKIIEELDIGMRRQFEEKFREIRAEFDKVFKELFGGGRGTLELMEGEDLLEAGIQIIAQPPGKKLQNMMQLSGGEKALTAISLLFAIQNLKPSPFCLLDEIEAALDDSNVDRFANYLHKLTKNTQFIVITHRRGTMMAADRLYGITMQEKGVSTLVSVNLIEDSLTK